MSKMQSMKTKPRYKIITRGPSGHISYSSFRFIAILRAKLRSVIDRNVEVIDAKTDTTIWPKDKPTSFNPADYK